MVESAMGFLEITSQSRSSFSSSGYPNIQGPGWESIEARWQTVQWFFSWYTIYAVFGSYTESRHDRGREQGVKKAS